MESVKAVQTQVRTHTRSVRGRRRRSAAAAELPEVPGEATCAACGEIVPRSTLMFGDRGEVCDTCHGDDEDRGAARIERLRAAPRAAARGLAVFGAGVSLVVVAALFGSSTIEHAVAWFLVVAPATIVGGLLTLLLARETRTRQLLEADLPEPVAVAVHALATGLALCGVLAVLAVPAVLVLH